MATNELQMYDVMFSYSWKQKQFVHDICERLQDRGISVWVDKDKISSGDIYQKMAEGVKNSRVFVMVISKDYKSSRNAQLELRAAHVEEKPIIPIRVDKYTDLDQTEFIIGGRLYFEFYNNEMDNFDNFHQAIIEELSEYKL